MVTVQNETTSVIPRAYPGLAEVSDGPLLARGICLSTRALQWKSRFLACPFAEPTLSAKADPSSLALLGMTLRGRQLFSLFLYRNSTCGM